MAGSRNARRIVLASALLCLCLSSPSGAQQSGVTLAARAGYDVMTQGQSGVAAELGAGYRWSSGFELQLGGGAKWADVVDDQPASPFHDGNGGGGFQVDLWHWYGELRHWFDAADSGRETAGFLGVRLGSADKQAVGFGARGPTYGVTAGTRFRVSPGVSVAPSVVADYLDVGGEGLDYGSFRVGLRLGILGVVGGSG